MADVQECIDKLVATGTISRAIGDQALDAFKRSKAEYSRSMGPVSADAAAALQAAREMRDKAASRQLKIAGAVKTWRDIERRVVDDPRGGMLAVVNLFSKDTLLGDNRLNALRRSDPEHPIFRGGSVDSNYRVIERELFAKMGPELEKFKGRGAAQAGDLVDELFGVDTGNKAAHALAAGMDKSRLFAENRAKLAGKEFEPNENWRVGQPWYTRRVEKFTEDEYAKWWHEKIDSGAVKLMEKEGPTPGRYYARPERYDDILKKAYHDIIEEGGKETPFSKQMRTFEFQPGKLGADAWKEAQAKFGAGNEIMETITQHYSHMAKDIALLETLGPNPQGAFEAAMRLAREKNPKEALVRGLRWFDSPLIARNTFNQVSGKGTTVGNEQFARVMSGTRQLLGAAALHNLPVNIVPSDIVATFIAAHHDGIPFTDIMRSTFDGKMTRQEAAQLEINAHSYKDFVQNNVRRYEDEINYSGIARAIPDFVIRATGANWWTENLRLGTQMGYFHKLAHDANVPWERLDRHVRDNFLMQYGINKADWDKIRSIEPSVAANGARSVNLPELTNVDRELSERLQRAVQERSSYMAHQPDARTRAIARGSAQPGTLPGETHFGFMQYKQFALERMSTHLMRILYEGTVPERVARGLAFTLLSTAAGAVAMQAAAVLAGKNPLDMYSPSFWMHAFQRGGVGGVYGDLLSEAFTGNAGAIGGAAGGTVGGLIGDVGKAVAAPVRHELFDAQGRRATANTAEDMISAGKRWTPGTWYTKLITDRYLWDVLQSMVDPNYRQSFHRANQEATRKGGTGYFFGPGAAVQ